MSSPYVTTINVLSPFLEFPSPQESFISESNVPTCPYGFGSIVWLPLVRELNTNPSPPSFPLAGQASVVKYLSLFLLCSQNAVLILVMRYVRVRPGDLFLSTTAVILAECCKLAFCLVLIFMHEGFSIRAWAKHLYENIIAQPMDCLKISIPSIVYTLQNNLLYVAVSNLEAATFQVRKREICW